MKRREIFVRPQIRRCYAAVAALSVGLLVAGCGGNAAATDSEVVFLQPAAARGPDPYTASTARNTGTVPPPPPGPSAPSGPSSAQLTLRTMSGSTPGLYGGTQSIGSCDVEQQISYLSGDQAKARAFAQGAGTSQADVAGFLRGLTPVVVRADTRVTNHGFRNGSAIGYQSVLQAGTAVLVDQNGAPRVRCACGNPLKPPVAVKGAVVHKGQPWPGYQPERVIVVEPATTIINNIVIVNIVDNAWIERRTGTDGEEDRPPEVLPPIDPDDVFTNPTGPSDSTSPSDDTQSSPTPTQTSPPVNPPAEPPVEPPATPDEVQTPPVAPDVPSQEGVDPSQPDLVIPSEPPAEPDTFQG